MYHQFRNARDVMSSYTHFIGACLSVIATAVMITLAILNQNDMITIVSIVVFGLSLIALYSASTIYHYIPAISKYQTFFRKLDHTMIYVLIAGSYTPIIMAFMEQSRALRFMAVIWMIALIGIVTKLIWLNAPRILYTLLYVGMGWAIVFDVNALAGIPLWCLVLIALGGISYSIGAVIYIIKKPNIAKIFGFHELFHIFIVIGSAFHVWAVSLFIV